MSKQEKFLESARSQVNKGIYVWGGNGENLLTMDDPEAWIRKKEKNKANAERAIDLFTARVADGIDPIRAFDCSGLVYWCQKEAGVGYSDHNAQGWYKECDPVKELREGDLVFHHNGIKCTHVGIYNGDGYVIEAIGRDLGVVLNRRVDEKYWNRQGRLKRMEDTPIELTKVKVIGGSVRVREGDHVGTKCVGIAHRGDEFPLLGNGASGWYMIDFNGTTAYITNKSKYTELA
jgi:hypothetical protein